MGIKALEIVSTDIPNSKSQKIMGVGSGAIFREHGHPVGPAYVSLTGKVALDDLGNPTSITATVTTGGGSPGNGPNGGTFIWSGKPKIVLLKQQSGHLARRLLYRVCRINSFPLEVLKSP